jgi:hypothetical protein
MLLKGLYVVKIAGKFPSATIAEVFEILVVKEKLFVLYVPFGL